MENQTKLFFASLFMLFCITAWILPSMLIDVKPEGVTYEGEEHIKEINIVGISQSKIAFCCDYAFHVLLSECINKNQESCNYFNMEGKSFQKYPKGLHYTMAYASRLTGLPPLIIYSIVMPFIILLLIPFLIYRITKELYEDEATALLATVLLFMINTSIITDLLYGGHNITHYYTLIAGGRYTQATVTAMTLLGTYLILRGKNLYAYITLLLSLMFHYHIRYFLILIIGSHLLAKDDKKKFMLYLTTSLLAVAVIAPFINIQYIRTWLMLSIFASPMIANKIVEFIKRRYNVK